MKKLLILGLFALFLTSCFEEEKPNICSGCKLEHVHYNNAADWSKLLHCKDTVYFFGPKGNIEKYPTNNK